MGFGGRHLWVWSDGKEYSETKLDSSGIAPAEFLEGISEGNIYAVTVYATKGVPEEGDNPWGKASPVLSIIAVLISLTTLVMSRKKELRA